MSLCSHTLLFIYFSSCRCLPSYWWFIFNRWDRCLLATKAKFWMSWNLKPWKESIVFAVATTAVTFLHSCLWKQHFLSSKITLKKKTKKTQTGPTLSCFQKSINTFLFSHVHASRLTTVMKKEEKKHKLLCAHCWLAVCLRTTEIGIEIGTEIGTDDM